MLLPTQGELEVFLSPAACKREASHVLFEMPGSVDLQGDSGVVGRMCKPLALCGDEICMDLKGMLFACMQVVLHNF